MRYITISISLLFLACILACANPTPPSYLPPVRIDWGTHPNFAQKVIDEGVAAGIDEDSMVETAEEFLATSLGKSLIWFAGEVDPEVLKESK